IFEISYNVCRKNNVKVADLYNSSLDTNIQELRWKYSFDDLGSDNLPGNMGTVSSEKFSDSYPTGTHPNFLAVEEFYVPAVTEALLDKNNTGFTAWGFVEGGQLKVHAKTDSGVLVLALYVDRGLLSASVFTGSITVPYREEITKIKVFNWDRLQTLIPLNNYIDIDPFFFS
ncbi:MAG: hypothetical protein GX196_03090, partial [Clostridiaceae bacterium]|nr:hypothetical protein [Clostridiaceae bacterium]